jgi:hypothetical protein
VREATTPASTLPSVGALATWASSIPETRPRISSGVAVSTIAERKAALTLSAAPASASMISASTSDVAKPKRRIAAPHRPAAIATATPWRRTWLTQPESSVAASAPA